jgi:hypothetical protein
MSIFILKIVGFTIFVLASIIGVCILWPAKSLYNEQSRQQTAPESGLTESTSRKPPELEDSIIQARKSREMAALLRTIYRNTSPVRLRSMWSVIRTSKNSLNGSLSCTPTIIG